MKSGSGRRETRRRGRPGTCRSLLNFLLGGVVAKARAKARGKRRGTATRRGDEGEVGKGAARGWARWIGSASFAKGLQMRRAAGRPDVHRGEDAYAASRTSRTRVPRVATSAGGRVPARTTPRPMRRETRRPLLCVFAAEHVHRSHALKTHVGEPKKGTGELLAKIHAHIRAARARRVWVETRLT